MEVTYLGHAGFVVETNEAIIVMDPWLSPSGAFNSSWFQFPANHHLGTFVDTILRSADKARYIYISHEHQDHFDWQFLSNLSTNEFTFVIPRFRRTYLYDRLKQIPCQSVVLCGDGESVEIPGGSITLFLEDAELDRDSAILLSVGGHSMLNLNDCKLFDRLPQIVANCSVDVFTAQFSGAVWHPVCYDYPQRQYEAISRRKKYSKFEAIARALTAVKPRLYLTSAGPACFLDPELIDINFQSINIFPRAPELFSYLERRLHKSTPCWFEPMPGDSFDAASGSALHLVPNRVTDANYEAYIRAYAKRMRRLFESRQAPTDATVAAHTIDQLIQALRDKLATLTLRDRITIPLYFRLVEAPDRLVRVDFGKPSVTEETKIVEGDYYAIEARARDAASVLSGELSWEDLMLSLRIRLHRSPDIYNTLIHGFLTLDAADLNWFCAKVLDGESSSERILVDAGDRTYSTLRFCPHQHADLSHGWIERDRYLVCPRHRWRYDLTRGGQCVDDHASVRAIEVD